jgi:hypothetical protein
MAFALRTPAPTSSRPTATLAGILKSNESYTGVQIHDLPEIDPDYAAARQMAQHHNSKDSVKPMTKDEQEAQRELAWQMVKKLTMSIFKMDFLGISFPVGFNEQRTFLERSADLFSFLVTEFMDKCCETDDHHLRLSFVAVGIVTSFHLVLTSKKPWNPAIGKTYVGRWRNGTTMFCEQICQRPPISAIQIRPANNRWTIDSQIQFGIDQGLTQVNLSQSGTTRLTLEDGTVCEWGFPKIPVLGILRGDRIVKAKGPLVVNDLTHHLKVMITVRSKKSREARRYGISKARATTIFGGVRRLQSDGDFVMKVAGDYADTICLDGRVAWTLERSRSSRPAVKVEESDLMPSDTRYRLDRSLLIEGDVVGAEDAKNVMEQI